MSIDEMMKKLPRELQREMEGSVQFQGGRYARKHGKKLRQDWAGALRNYRDQYTSLELQKKLEWQGE